MFDQWYYFANGKKLGPVSLSSLKKLVEEGVVRSDSEVFREGLRDWVLAREVPEIVSHSPSRAEIAEMPYEPTDHASRPVANPSASSKQLLWVVVGGIGLLLLVSVIGLVAIVAAINKNGREQAKKNRQEEKGKPVTEKKPVPHEDDNGKNKKLEPPKSKNDPEPNIKQLLIGRWEGKSLKGKSCAIEFMPFGAVKTVMPEHGTGKYLVIGKTVAMEFDLAGTTQTVTATITNISKDSLTIKDGENRKEENYIIVPTQYEKVVQFSAAVKSPKELLIGEWLQFHFVDGKIMGRKVLTSRRMSFNLDGSYSYDWLENDNSGRRTVQGKWKFGASTATQGKLEITTIGKENGYEIRLKEASLQFLDDRKWPGGQWFRVGSEQANKEFQIWYRLSEMQ